MTPETLHRLFDVVADAPGGVQRLRELILQLAVRGKLVPQDPGDEPASVLLERIEAEKERLYAAGKIRKPKKLPPVEADEVPFEVPEGWEWVRLGMLGALIRGVSYSKSDAADVPSPDRAPILRAHNINGVLNFENLVYVLKEKIKPEQYVKAGDLLIAMSSGSKNLVGKAAQANTDYPGAFGAFCGAYRPYVHALDAYLRWYCQTDLYRSGVARASQGIGINNLRTSDVLEALIPVPPLSEQRRIVEKVEQLMALCDELEERQRRRAEKRVSLNRSALHHLATATDDVDLARHWRRIRDHFDVLYEVPETVAELRQAILQLAVRGKLVPQDPNDEPASVLLERIEEEKRRLYEEGKIRKLERLPPVEPDEVTLPVPKGWAYVRLLEIGEFCGGATPSKNTAGYWGGHIPWISPKDMGAQDITGSEDFITERALKETRLRLIPPGSLLIVARSGILRRTLPVSINRVPCTVNQDLKVLIPYMAELAEYLRLMLRGYESLIIRDLVKGGVTVQSLKFSQFAKFPFPLPPLEEQRRIVAKVNELMALCDELEERLSNSRALAESIAAAVVHELTAA